MNWHIGQRIVAVVDHKEAGIAKGDEFVVKGIMPSFCKCKELLLDIGKSHPMGVACSKCMAGIYSNIWWLSEFRFAPKQPIPELSELTDAMILTATEIEELQTA